ncbi:MAG: transketolase family protein [Candidatus Aureabacteria bacterium]|nr:transketolase family protein [Candidatus Auribacterota bacterium]
MKENTVNKGTRDAYGEILVELGKDNKNIVVLDADLGSSTRAKKFGDSYPERFFNVGIAEQNMMGIAAGLACTGKTVFASTFAIFATGRPWEQIRNSICFSKLNVKIVATHGGITVGEDGGSHQSVEDISLMRSLPNMNIIIPCDYIETKKAIREIIKIKEPYYVRLGRAKYPIITSDDTPFEFGKGIVFKEGNDVSLISTGTMIDFSLKAAEELAKNNISAEVIHLHTIKPIDEQLILATSVKTGAIVTIEEHSIIGGLGSAVSESVCANHPVPVERIGIQDKFGRSGTPSELIKAYNLDVPDICAAARKVINKKGS